MKKENPNRRIGEECSELVQGITTENNQMFEKSPTESIGCAHTLWIRLGSCVNGVDDMGIVSWCPRIGISKISTVFVQSAVYVLESDARSGNCAM